MPKVAIKVTGDWAQQRPFVLTIVLSVCEPQVEKRDRQKTRKEVEGTGVGAGLLP